MIADGRVDGTRLHELVSMQEDAIKRAAGAPELTPMETSDAEDELGEWLEEQRHHRRLGHRADAGLRCDRHRVAGARCATRSARRTSRTPLRWLTYTLDTEQLMTEIDDSVTRISSLVAAAKQYSQLDRAPHQTVNVHELLHATLVMLHAKFPPGIKLVKEYDRSLPGDPGVRRRSSTRCGPT